MSLNNSQVGELRLLMAVFVSMSPSGSVAFLGQPIIFVGCGVVYESTNVTLPYVNYVVRCLDRFL
jgi:hypothetical protein